MSTREEKRSGLPTVIWVGIAAWVLLAVLAILWGLPNEENDLEDRASQALEGSGLTVTVAGRDATITGDADQATIDAAADTVYELRGVRRVDASAANAVVLDEPSFIARFRAEALELSGVLPSQAVIDSITTAAVEAYGADHVAYQLEVGAVSEPAYLAALPRIFTVARGLEPWEFRLENGRVTYTGMGPDPDTVAAKRSAFAEYREAAALPEVEDSLETEPGAVAASLTDLLAGGANFETGSAVLSAEATAKLDEIIQVMMDNPSTMLIVAGHTDNQGDPAANRALSEARAQAVVDYLVQGGIAADRLSAVGYGEEQPIAGNDTEEGRAKNRRIEFVVTEGE